VWAVIFDMNGVLIDDMGYHNQAWRTYRHKLAGRISKEGARQDLTGRTNREIFSILLGRQVTEAESLGMEVEKEELYRRLYHPHLSALPGLESLLKRLKAEGIPVALATSGPTANVNFILDGLKIRDYFGAIVDAGQITRGKPHPDIFLAAAKKLGISPEACLVFEDSLLGIKGARRAGMQVIGITTTLPAGQLKDTALAVADFTEVTFAQISRIARSA